MTRDPSRIDPILARLRAAWHRSPDLRLGQLLVGSLPAKRVLFQAECHEFGAPGAPIEWPPADVQPPPVLDLDAVEAAAEISDDQLVAWLAVAGAASPAALQYGQTRGDGRAFIIDAYDKGTAGPVHTVWYGDPDDALIVAVTGNGPTSEANAKHIAWSSPRNVAALIAEARALRAEVVEQARKNREALRDLAAAQAKLAEAKQLGLEAVRLAESADLDAMASPRGAGGCGAATKYTNDIAAAQAALEAL